jgi:hypothetical protein
MHVTPTNAAVAQLLLVLALLALLVVGLAYLPAYFARLEKVSMHVPVSGPRQQRGRDYGKVTGANVLSWDRDYAGGCKLARNRAASCRACWGAGRSIAEVRAEEQKDASGDMYLAKVNVCLQHIRGETRIGQRIGEHLKFLVELQIERARAWGKNGPGLSVERAEFLKA